MTFHLAAFQESHDNTANTDVAAVTDTILRINNDHIVLDQDRDLIFGAMVCTDAQRARLVYPKARQFSLPFLAPVVDDAVRSNPMAIADYRDNPLRIPAREELAAEATHDNVGSVVDSVVIALSRGPLPPRPSGERYTMRGTSTTSATTGGWRALTMTWPDTLPNGSYAVVGMRYTGGAGVVAARLVFEDQVDRPGVIGTEDENQAAWPPFRNGSLGGFGAFTGDRMPNVEVLVAATLAAHTIYLDFVRIA